MASNYRKLGDYIEQTNERNSELLVDKLLGVSIEKKFIPSIANTIGTDFSGYKIVHPGEFAYGPVTSRNGDKISIAFYEGNEDCIISSSYTPFALKNSGLLPEYLMMWFDRSEFDRYARFKSHGSAREVFDWDQLCAVELPIPEIDIQQKIVSIKNCIDLRAKALAEQNDYLTQMGIAIVTRMVSGVSLVGLSPGAVAGINLPANISVQTIGDFCEFMGAGSTPPRGDSRYWRNAVIPWVKSGEVCGSSVNATEEKISKVALEETSVKLFCPGTILIAMYGVTAGQVGYLDIEATTNQAVCGMVCDTPDRAAYLYFMLLRSQEEIARLANGGAQSNLSKKVISDIPIPIPATEIIESSPLRLLLKNIAINSRERSRLAELRDVLLPKLMSGEIAIPEVQAFQHNTRKE